MTASNFLNELSIILQDAWQKEILGLVSGNKLSTILVTGLLNKRTTLKNIRNPYLNHKPSQRNYTKYDNFHTILAE